MFGGGRGEESEVMEEDEVEEGVGRWCGEVVEEVVDEVVVVVEVEVEVGWSVGKGSDANGRRAVESGLVVVLLLVLVVGV